MLLNLFIILSSLPPGLEQFQKTLSWKDWSATLQLQVSSDGNKPKEMLLRIRADEEGQMLRLDFEKPIKLKGMKFLALAPRDAQDTWAIYIKAIRRVMTLPLDASNYMIRDMLSLGFFKLRPELFQFEALDEMREINGVRCKLFRGRPLNSKVERQFGFEAFRLCLDKTPIVRQLEFIKGGKVLRTQEVLAFEQTAGGLLPTQIRAIDHQEGGEKKITEIKILKRRINQGLSKEIFSRRALSRR